MKKVQEFAFNYAVSTGVGMVEAHGEGAGKLQKGTRVVAIWPCWPAAEGNGTWQQYICVPESTMVRCLSTV